MNYGYIGARLVRELDDGRVIVVYPMIYTWRVCIGPTGSGEYDDAWCYEREASALAAAAAWDGRGDPPDGWHRHVSTGRRRPDGDPAREYVMR